MNYIKALKDQIEKINNNLSNQLQIDNGEFAGYSREILLPVNGNYYKNKLSLKVDFPRVKTTYKQVKNNVVWYLDLSTFECNKNHAQVRVSSTSVCDFSESAGDIVDAINKKDSSNAPTVEEVEKWKKEFDKGAVTCEVELDSLKCPKTIITDSTLLPFAYIKFDKDLNVTLYIIEKNKFVGYPLDELDNITYKVGDLINAFSENTVAKLPGGKKIIEAFVSDNFFI